MIGRKGFLAGLGASAAAMLARPSLVRAQGESFRAGIKLSPTSMDPHFRLSG
ncbi:MAG: hypothetical protein IT556_09140, partial [Acetobacteraceae bacterium]|nr:hypothetical protein [Acetobacteraceae bacterium]